MIGFEFLAVDIPDFLLVEDQLSTDRISIVIV
jgi:hypothetical protein